MDLGTIKKRLENKYYCSAKECIDDFDVMFTNFHVYNKPWNPSVHEAMMVEKLFLRKMALMPEEEVELGSSAATAASFVYPLRMLAANKTPWSVYPQRMPAAITAALRMPTANKTAWSVYPLRMPADITAASSVYPQRMPAANTAAM